MTDGGRQKVWALSIYNTKLFCDALYNIYLFLNAAFNLGLIEEGLYDS